MAEAAKAVLKVKAHGKEHGPKWVGYYEHKRRKDGDVFILNDAKDFSAKWMEPIGWKPEGYDPTTRTVAKKKDQKPLPRTALSRNQAAPSVPAAPAEPEDNGGAGSGGAGPKSDDAI